MRRPFLNIAPGLTLTVCFLLPTLGHADETSRGTWGQRLLKEAPRRWAEWHDAFRGNEHHVEIDLRVTSLKTPPKTGSPDGQWDEVGSQKRVFDQAGAKHVSILTTPKSRELAWGMNERYHFVLNRASKTWEVREMGSPDQVPADVQERYFGQDETVHPQFAMEGLKLTELFKDPSFTVTSAEAVDDGRRIKVEFRANVAPNRSNKITRGTAWFLPDPYWLMEEYDIHLSSRTEGTAHRKMTYREFAGLPVLERMTLDYRFTGDAPLNHTYQFEWKPGPLADNLFNLSRFGLPEPGLNARGASRGTSSLIWLNVGAIVLIFLWFTVRRRMARGRTTITTGQ